MSNGFEAIAHPTRRDMLTLLAKGSLNAGEISDHFDITNPGISNHLKILVNSGLVSKKKDKQFQIYSINRDGIKKLINFVGRLLK